MLSEKDFKTLTQAMARGEFKYVKTQLRSANEATIEGATLLMDAMRRNDLKGCLWLVEQGALVHETDFARRTALHWLVEGPGSLALADLCGNYGVDMNARDGRGKTALEHGVEIHLQTGIDNTGALLGMVRRWASWEDERGGMQLARKVMQIPSFGPELRNRAAGALREPYPCSVLSYLKGGRRATSAPEGPWDRHRK